MVCLRANDLSILPLSLFSPVVIDQLRTITQLLLAHYKYCHHMSRVVDVLAEVSQSDRGSYC